MVDDLRILMAEITAYAREHPDVVAVECGAEGLGYGGLVERVTRRAADLAGADVIAPEPLWSVDFVVDTLAGWVAKVRPLPSDTELSPLSSVHAMVDLVVEWGIGRGDRLPVCVVPGAATTVEDVFVPLLVAATVVVPESDPASVVNWLREHRITSLRVTAAVAGDWLRSARTTCPDVRAVLFHGEPPTTELLAEWATVFPGTGDRIDVTGDSEDPDMDVPLSYAQQRLWFMNQMDGPSAAYNIPMSLRIRDGLDVAALRAAARDVVTRHEVLRTVYPVRDGEVWQQVLSVDEAGFDVQVVAVADLDNEVTRAVGSQFDLATDLSIRMWVFESAGECVLVLVLHHVAADGWSMGPLWTDLGFAYQARRAGREPVWDDLAVQYADYALWQRELLGSGDDKDSMLALQVGYWRSVLAGAPEEIRLPVDRPRPAAASHEGGLVEMAVPASVHAGLVRLAREQGVTVFMALHAAVAVLLARLGAGLDVVVGTAVAGRSDEALEGLVGFFVNTLVLRTDLSGNPSFAQLLNRVRAVDLGAFAHQDVPFERLVEELAPARSMSRSPLFHVMLAVQDENREVVELPGVTVEPYPAGAPAARFDLSIEMNELSDAHGRPCGIDGNILFAADLFDRSTVEVMAARLVRVLEAVVADPSLRVGDVPVLGPVERDRMVVDWNDTARPVPHVTVVELFEQRVAASPDEVAVVVGDVSLTYAELDALANELAAALRDLGVGLECRVVVLLPRSVDAVVACRWMSMLRRSGSSG